MDSNPASASSHKSISPEDPPFVLYELDDDSNEDMKMMVLIWMEHDRMISFNRISYDERGYVYSLMEIFFESDLTFGTHFFPF